MFLDYTVAQLLMGREHPMNRGSRLDCPKVIFIVSMPRPLMFSVHVFVQQWYTSTMNLIGTWLTDRMDLQLHLYQLKILIRIVKKKYRDFRLQGVLDSTLNSKMYETVRNRLTLEEATASVREGGMQGISMKDSDEENN
ncbi:Calcium-dependent secretion activator 1 [Takifugu flavidus]|uniref:Calcium-dependent secretion activator 1 n=1 Tax=Takifugu flavidus TaxID=433684 RepID=A0A5C6N9W3_9TELE|nr:Calcium-dependent secretion activator 1 [Takifugu flavidus]